MRSNKSGLLPLLALSIVLGGGVWAVSRTYMAPQHEGGVVIRFLTKKFAEDGTLISITPGVTEIDADGNRRQWANGHTATSFKLYSVDAGQFYVDESRGLFQRVVKDGEPAVKSVYRSRADLAKAYADGRGRVLDRETFISFGPRAPNGLPLNEYHINPELGAFVTLKMVSYYPGTTQPDMIREAVSIEPYKGPPIALKPEWREATQEDIDAVIKSGGARH